MIGGISSGNQAGVLGYGNSGFAVLSTATPENQQTSWSTIISNLTNAAFSAYLIHEQNGGQGNKITSPPTGGGVGQKAAGTPSVPSNAPNIALYVLGGGLLLGSLVIGVALARK